LDQHWRDGARRGYQVDSVSKCPFGPTQNPRMVFKDLIPHSLLKIKVI